MSVTDLLFSFEFCGVSTIKRSLCRKVFHILLFSFEFCYCKPCGEAIPATGYLLNLLFSFEFCLDNSGGSTTAAMDVFGSCYFLLNFVQCNIQGRCSAISIGLLFSFEFCAQLCVLESPLSLQ